MESQRWRKGGKRDEKEGRCLETKACKELNAKRPENNARARRVWV